MGLLCSRSRSQWRSRQYFLNHSTFSYQIWYGDVASWARVMQTFCCCCYLQGQGHSEDSFDQNMTFFFMFWTVDSLATKPGLMIHHQKPECPVKKNGLLHLVPRSQQRVRMLMFVQKISFKPPNFFFLLISVLWCCPDVIICGWLGSKHQLSIVMHRYESGCHAKRLNHYFQGQGHCKNSYDQIMTIAAVSFELLILLLPNLVW